MYKNVQRKEGLECKVCMNPFSDSIGYNIPRMLDCGHTVCHSCAESLQKVASDKRSIRCPFDRHVTDGFYENVENLRRNYAIIDLIQARNEEAGLAEEVICEDPIIPCYENSKHESTKYCQACKVDFCNSCFLSVHSSKILSGHQSIPISEKPIRLPNCPNHPDSIAEHYCKDKNCEASTPLCCFTCLQSAHKNHTVVPMEEKADENERELMNLLETKNLTEIKGFEKLEKAKKCIRSIETDDAECRSMTKAIGEHFEREKKKAILKLSDFMNTNMMLMESNKYEIEINLERIRKTKKSIEKVLKKKDLFFVKETIEQGESVCSLNFVEEGLWIYIWR
ncbi:hypothetical protein CAEBREN_22010 [Caenorhabditis brenneri]|uniref:RING-type domain-containing protein n=1 Tax=Caenorhabditis brenneri TaxID=135651 RepID=G0N3R6_CAEBE|nr:hypothetical protein CAEBREN_22010 [Caenorhabditis brenneri]